MTEDEMENDNPHGLTSQFENMDMNLPVQAFREDGVVSFVVYVPRKQRFYEDNEERTPQEASAVAHDAAKLLRNLALLMDAFAEGLIDSVYYPDEIVPVGETNGT